MTHKRAPACAGEQKQPARAFRQKKNSHDAAAAVVVARRAALNSSLQPVAAICARARLIAAVAMARRVF